MYKRMVVAVGDYPALDTAVAYAIALAADSDAELWLLRVLTVPPLCGAPGMITSSHLTIQTGTVERLLSSRCDAVGCLDGSPPP
jgi:nucleotide-binding universal stress UspA family protein